MFSPGRLVTLGILALLVYLGFYAVPTSGPGAADFQPEVVARYEAAAWQAARQRNELPTIVNSILYQRELHRLSWFRAVESGLPMARSLQQFQLMLNRFERVLPQLEQVASIEQQWKDASFDPAQVARAQLNWMVMARNAAHAGNARQSVTEMAHEYSLRFGLQPGLASGAAADRALAFQLVMRDAEPDWDQLRELLARAYGSLQAALAASATAASR